LSTIKYPKCRVEPKRRVSCLIGAIKRDRRPPPLGPADKEHRCARIAYLYALNKKHRWEPLSSARAKIRRAQMALSCPTVMPAKERG